MNETEELQVVEEAEPDKLEEVTEKVVQQGSLEELIQKMDRVLQRIRQRKGSL